MNKEHDHPDTQQGVGTIVLARFASKEPCRHNAANPGPVQHHMQDDADGKNTEGGEERFRPVQWCGIPDFPVGPGSPRKNHMQHGKHPGLRQEQNEQHHIEPEIDDRAVTIPE